MAAANILELNEKTLHFSFVLGRPMISEDSEDKEL